MVDRQRKKQNGGFTKWGLRETHGDLELGTMSVFQSLASSVL